VFVVLKQPNFDFMRYGRRVMAISVAAVLAALVVIAERGINYGVEFAGGTELQLRFQEEQDLGAIRATVQAFSGREGVVTTIGPEANHEIYIKIAGTAPDGSGQDLTTRNTDSLRSASVRPGLSDLNAVDVSGLQRLLREVPSVSASEAESLARAIAERRDGVDIFRSVEDLATIDGMRPEVLEQLRQRTYAGPLVLRSQSYVGPAIGAEQRSSANWAIVGSLLGMLVYIWVRFQFEWGLAAVVALFHDVALTLGLFVLLDLEMTLAVVAAFLTLVGYSVNDTVVIFDRIRENLKARVGGDLESTINLSINQTLSRTIITAGLTFLVVFVLLLVGGSGLQSFSFVLSAGIIFGSYSTFFVACPFIVVWRAFLARRAAARASVAGSTGPETERTGRARKIRAAK
jgi:preprotein translocase subunit SecF